MRVFRLKSFQRLMRINALPDDYLKAVLKEILSDRSTALGAKIFKVRIARKGAGKSSGYRNIFFWKKDELLIFIYLFSKNQKDNISIRELRELKILANEFNQLSEDELNIMVKNNDLQEIKI